LLRKGSHPNIHLQRAWNKYGEDSFIFKVIAVCDKDSVLDAEQFWIDTLNTYKKGFNRCPVARNSSGIKRSEETLEKMRKLNNYKKANEAWKGSNHTEETRAVIKAKRAEQVMEPWSEERRRKHKETMVEVNRKIHRGQARRSKFFNVVAENETERHVFKNTQEAKIFFNFRNVNGITRVLRGERTEYKGYRWFVESPIKIE